jgi:hypothetical protein
MKKDKLFLTIKKKYFDDISNNVKKEEYRLFKPYWIKRILNKNYSHIVFRNGYSKDSPILEIEYLGYEVKNMKCDFFGPDSLNIFVLKLGAIQ